MRALDTQIQAAIQGRLTSFIVCWRIQKNDGTFLYGTEHDRDVVVTTGDLAGTYESEFNIKGSDVKSSSDLSVDNLEVEGASDQGTLGQTVRVADIESGVLDQARVIIFLADWTDPDAGQVIIRAGYIGQINRDSDTRYRAEVRGLLQKLSQQIGQNYSDMCNVIRFGDERCKFDVASITQACVVDEVISRKVFYAVILDPDAAALPSMLPLGGEVHWTSGGNTGFEREVKELTYTGATYTFKVELYEEAAADIAPGDLVDVVPGCDRQMSTCRFVYDNLVNFRGYGAYVPGILAIMRGNSLSECTIAQLLPPGVDPSDDGAGSGGTGGTGGDPPPPPPGTDPLPTDPPPPVSVPPPPEDGRNVFWNGAMANGRVGPGALLGLGFMGCKYEPEGGVDSWAGPKNGGDSGPIDAGSVAANLDQRVVNTDSFGGVTIQPRRPGTYFMRQRIYYTKQYECMNNHHDPDAHWDKPRCYWTPTENQTGHDYDREVWLGFSVFLHPDLPHDLLAPRGHNGGPALCTMEASDNFSQAIMGIYKPPASDPGRYVGSDFGDNHFHWHMWVATDDQSVNQPAHEYGTPKTMTYDFGDIEDDLGMWTDFVWRYRFNPFAVSTNAATKGGRNHVYEGNKGILQVWKSVGAYVDGNRNRVMERVLNIFNAPVGCVPHATLRLCGARQGVYHYGWKHNATSSTAPRYYAHAQSRWGFRKPPEAGEIFTQFGTKDTDVNPSGAALPDWDEQDGYVDPTPPPDPGDNGALEVYAAVAGHTSPSYTATVSQGGVALNTPVLYTPEVMRLLIDGAYEDLTYQEHWTQVCRDTADGPCTFVVHLPGASVAGAVVRSGDWTNPDVITPIINTLAHTITFDLTESGQYYVYVPSMEKVSGVADSGAPLFIWLSDLDTNVPQAGAGVVIFNPGDTYTVPPGTTKVRFKPGVHNVDPLFGTTGHLTPADFQTQYGREIYIDGGAWVNGMINGQAAGSGQLLIRGKGTLSGEKYATASIAENTAYKMIEVAARAGGTVRVEGITIVDAPSKNFIVNDDTFSTYDLKVFGVTGDFATMQDGATADLCFTMVNDDHYKFFHPGARVTRSTHWLRKVGPAFQCSWNNAADVTDCQADQFCIVGADRPGAPSPGVYTQCINNSIISIGDIQGASLTDYRFKRGTSWVEVWQLIGLRTKGCLTGFTTGLGDVDGWLLQDIAIPSQTTFSYFNANGASTGRITGVTFDNVTVGGTKITSANKDTYLKWAGIDDSATFNYA